jgi:hypothetical protein
MLASYISELYLGKLYFSAISWQAIFLSYILASYISELYLGKLYFSAISWQAIFLSYILASYISSEKYSLPRYS